MSSTTKLSHSAAKHKIAVRPKKKVPTRNRRSREVSSALPATPEDSEEFTHKFVSVDIPGEFPLAIFLKFMFFNVPQ